MLRTLKIFLVLALALVFTQAAFSSDEFDSATFQKIMDYHKSHRKPASASVSDSQLSPAFKAFRDKFLKVKTADQLEALLVEGEKNYDSYPIDLQYFVAQFELIRPYRSIVYRLRPVFEKNRSVQSFAVTTLKSIASGLRIYLPTSQWEAGFEYITVPSVNDGQGQNRQFKTIPEFQAFLISIVPEYKKALTRIINIYKTHPEAEIVWDNKLLYGPGTFEDSLDRYRLHASSEIAGTISAGFMSLQAIYAFCSYNQNDLLEVYEALGRLVGINGFDRLFSELGISDENRHGVLMRPNFKNFLTLLPIGESTYMRAALQYLRMAVSYLDASWKIKATDASNDYAWFNPLKLQADRRVIDLRIANMVDIVKGKTPLRSVVTGEVAEVNYPEFYMNPPKDIKRLFPVEFDRTPQFKTVNGQSGKSYEYRNYFRGRAIGWDAKAWAPYIPSISQNSDVGVALRIFNQSWGGDFLAPVADVIAR